MRAIISHNDYHLLRIEPDQVDRFLPAIRAILETAMPYTAGFESLDQMVATMRQGARPWQLWIMLDGDRPVGGFISTMTRRGKEYLFTFEILAGESAQAWIMPLIDNFEQYLAEIYGVTQTQIYGRPGWSRFLRDKGYSSECVITSKKIIAQRALESA